MTAIICLLIGFALGIAAMAIYGAKARAIATADIATMRAKIKDWECKGK